MASKSKLPNTPEAFKKFHDERIKEMPTELLDRAVKFLRDKLTLAVKKEIADLYKKDPVYWATSYHFFWGMTIRNLLRTECGISDDQLPTGNWDDYYVRCIELAVGVVTKEDIWGEEE